MSRRIAIAVAVVALGLLPACMAASSRPPECTPSSGATILLAQSVPGATRVPCLSRVPIGWQFDGMRVTNDGAEMWLSTNTGGVQAVSITFAATCEIGDAQPVSPWLDEAGGEVFLELTSHEPIRGARYHRFEGGCITTTYAFPPGSPSGLVREADDALAYVPRFQLVNHVETAEDGILCGAAAPPCEDG